MQPGLATCLALAVLKSLATADERPLPQLVAVGVPVIGAELKEIDADGRWHFRTVDGQAISLPPDELVRWSTPPLRQPADIVLLADGSLVRLAAAWGEDASFSPSATKVRLKTQSLGTLELPRSQVSGAFWRLPTDGPARQQRIDALLSAQANGPASDVVLLDNGDLVTGSLAGIGPSTTSDVVGPVASINGPLGALQLQTARIRGIALATAETETIAGAGSPATLSLGLRDGSSIVARAARGAGEKLTIQSAALGTLHLAPSEVAWLQGLSTGFAYLSDLDPVGFRHEPYLDLQQPLVGDRTTLGGPPTVDGKPYAKWLRMPTASRVTYRPDDGRQRFAATVAVDDSAGGKGSVVFRVFLGGERGWREAFASPVVRGGDPPVEIAVDLAGADQLALVVDYADRGDECDDAVWLDARLESAAP